MVDPRVRRERLRQDFSAMERLRCEAIDFETDGSEAPDRYVLRFRLRSLLAVRGDEPVYTPADHVHRVELRLPSAYPERLSNDDVTFLSAPIFHPNVFSDGRICIRRYHATESLAKFVLRLAHYIQCDPDFTGLDSPANGSAKAFFSVHPELFPTDRTVLPDSDKKTFMVRPASVAPAIEKRRFVVRPASAPRRRFVVSTGGGN